MKWNVGTRIGVGFGLALVVFIIVGTVSYRSTTQLIDASDARRHTNEVLSRIAEMETLAADMQSGVRGYAIAGDESYLEPYQAALGRTDEVIVEIRSLTVDNARQQRRLDALEPSVRNRLDLAKETVDVVRTKGPAAGLDLVKTGKGRALTGEIRKVLNQMESEENALLKQRTEAAQTDAQNAKLTIVLGTL